MSYTKPLEKKHIYYNIYKISHVVEHSKLSNYSKLSYAQHDYQKFTKYACEFAQLNLFTGNSEYNQCQSLNPDF